MFDLVPAHQQLRAPIHFDKEPTGALYLRQPHTVIQLVEVSPPPPRRISSVINSSSAASSSYSSASSSSFDEDDEEEIEVEEEEESICSSYCSSDDYAPESLEAQAFNPTDSDSGAFARRMKRILLWRENSEAPLSGVPSSFRQHSCIANRLSADSSLKRKLEEIEEPLVDDDNVRQVSYSDLAVQQLKVSFLGLPQLQAVALPRLLHVITQHFLSRTRHAPMSRLRLFLPDTPKSPSARPAWWK